MTHIKKIYKKLSCILYAYDFSVNLIIYEPIILEQSFNLKVREFRIAQKSV